MLKIAKELQDRLPVHSLTKLQRITQFRDDALDERSGISQRLLDLRREVTRLDQRRELFLRDQRVKPSAGGGIEFDQLERAGRASAGPFDVRSKVILTTPRGTAENRLKEFDDERASLAAELTRLSARNEVLNARTQQSTALLNSIEAWLNALPKDIDLAPGAPAAAKIGQVAPDAIEQRQRRIRHLLADIAQVDAAPFPSGEAKQLVRREIEQLAQRGRPSFHPVIERGESIEWPQQILKINAIGAISDASIDHSNAMFAWLMRDQLIAAAEKGIDEESDDAAALTAAERSARFKTLFADLLAVQRDEEALIEAANFDADRRGDADPRAVLDLSSELPGPKRNLFHSRMLPITA